MRSFPVSELGARSALVLDAALSEPVALTEEGKPKLVVLSIEAWERLAFPRSYTLENAPEPVPAEVMAGLDRIIKAKAAE